MPLTTKSFLVPKETFVPEVGPTYVKGKTRVRPDSPEAKRYKDLLEPEPEPDGSTGKGDMLVAAESFVGVLPSGADFVGTMNVTRVRSTDAAAKLWPHLFKPLEVSYPDVEQATAAPGEKRGG